MKSPLCLLGCAVLILAGFEKAGCFGKPLNRFPLGTIGCSFSGSLCNFDEECKDDLLFGHCHSRSIPGSSYRYQLELQELEVLEKHIWRLIKQGLTWKDEYTQCVLQNVLVALQHQKSFNDDICKDLTFDWSLEATSEIESALDNIYRKYVQKYGKGLVYDDIDSSGNLPFVSSSHKRDEIVQVHKYFDKSQALNKRRNYKQHSSPNYLNFYPNDGGLENLRELNLRGRSSDSGASNEEVRAVEDYLHALDGSSVLDQLEYLKNKHLGKGNLGKGNLFLASDWASNELTGNTNLIPGYSWTEGKKKFDQLPAQTDGGSRELFDAASPENEAKKEGEMALPPDYANLLGKLLQGEITPDELSKKELKYLSLYVSTMLSALGQNSSPGSPDLNHAEAYEADGDETSMMKQAEHKEPVQTELEKIVLLNNKDLAQNKQALIEALESDTGNEMAENIPSQKKSVLHPDEEEEIVRYPVPKNEVVSSTTEATNGTTVGKEPDVVNTDYAFIVVAQNLDRDSQRVTKLVDELEKLLSVPPNSISNITVIGNKVTFKVDPHITAGVNASEVATKANDHKNDLEKATGLTIVSSGIGDPGNQVDIKARDDRYFVLTFVLCGCIAGILLAVVVIYLIRRNTISKEKLAQLSSTTTDVNEASKDYQDLCRQRMQSKSSEKPEPLHAASRVSSVSEQQVRSPSSRSSTSSWSEEPVTSNMDISTGHIVLSYMEDHLKNKDRLDQEWEALCAYEADPASTKVASDPANARKNRYSDILPYDHSRVVLISAANVSGSDYINASTIMDHDPRNPAYIATQGPLPHTVADFWQMIWEQGSVVIVMLSKMTENGEAMCHRYWPEEGSDLYHIYEVHLVSEHIWCDDYLVRSFYLKNLQTNETRTVTQFHFLTWPDLGVPSSIKALLDFRRKVNKSYRGRSCPIAVHCSDGCGRTGTYTLVDMVINRMTKGAKEIDIAATLEHIRDQRMNMVKTKEQFQFALAAVAEEVNAILKALPQ